jgi:uncharacterized membrane protein YphA (DoxX/SURF4 family)
MTAREQTIGSSKSHAPGKALNVALWVVQIAGAAMFAMAGSSKFSSAAETVAAFEAIGLGQWFRYFTGSTELIGALLLLVPALSGVGGLLLTAVMVGALITHALIGGSAVGALVMLIAMAVVAYGRRDRTLKLLKRLL